MKIINYQTVETIDVPGDPGVKARRLISKNDGAVRYTMTMLEMPARSSGPAHTHPTEHEGFIVRGQGILVCDGQEKPYAEGDALFIPAHVPHQFKNPGETVQLRLMINPIVD